MNRSAMIFLEDKILDYVKNTLCFEIKQVKFVSRSRSNYAVKYNESFKAVPYCCLFMHESSYRKITIPPSVAPGLINKDYSQQITDYLGKVSQETDLDISEYYDKEMYIGACSFERSCYMDFAYSQKAAVKKLVKKVSLSTPKDVLASSYPGLNIIFDTEEYKKGQISLFERKIIEEIKHLAKKYVLEKYDCSCKTILRVKIWTPDMKGYNAYSLYRED